MPENSFWLLEGQGKLPSTDRKDPERTVHMGVFRLRQQFHRGHIEEQGWLVQAAFQEGTGSVQRQSDDEHADATPVTPAPFRAFTHTPKQHSEEATIGE